MLRADWRREYHRDLLDDLDDGMSWETFTGYVVGLSDQSRWRSVAGREPVIVTGDAARHAIANL